MDKNKMLRDNENASKRIRRTNAEIKKGIFDAVYRVPAFFVVTRKRLQ